MQKHQVKKYKRLKPSCSNLSLSRERSYKIQKRRSKLKDELRKKAIQTARTTKKLDPRDYLKLKTFLSNQKKKFREKLGEKVLVTCESRMQFQKFYNHKRYFSINMDNIDYSYNPKNTYLLGQKINKQLKDIDTNPQKKLKEERESQKIQDFLEKKIF